MRSERGQPVPRRGDRARIAVEAGDVGATLEQRERMPASAERAVEDAVRALEQREDLRREHRRVVLARPTAAVHRRTRHARPRKG